MNQRPSDYEIQINHLMWMCEMDQKAYAWSRAKQIESEYRDFAGLCDDLTKRMKAKNEAEKVQSMQK